MRFCYRDPRTNSLSKGTRLILSLVLLACLGAAGGCGYIKALAILSAPTTEKVEAEYDKLPGKRVAVYVWVPPEILWDYPKIRLDVSGHMTAYLQEHVENIRVVDPYRVEDYLRRSASPEVDAQEFADEFRADAVIKIAVFKFSMRDPGMSQFYRGRLSASVSVVDLTDADGLSQEVSLGEVAVVVPEDQGIGYTNIQPDQLRLETYRIFTIEAGKKFHEYERPLD